MVYAEVVSYTIESFDWYQYASLLEKNCSVCMAFSTFDMHKLVCKSFPTLTLSNSKLLYVPRVRQQAVIMWTLTESEMPICENESTYLTFCTMFYQQVKLHLFQSYCIYFAQCSPVGRFYQSKLSEVCFSVRHV